MRKEFNLQDWLKDKSQKVETRDGRPVKIISFEMTDTNNCPIAAQFRLCAGTPVIYLFDKEGHYKGEGYSDYDLFIVTPEEELTIWEKAIGLALTDAQLIPRDKDGIANIHDIDEFIKRKSAELLSLAREQLIKDGYVIEKKAFHDAVEKVDPKTMEEVSDSIDKKISENSGQLNEFEKRIKDLLAIKCEIFYNQDIEGCYDLKGLCDAILACAYKELQPEIEAKIENAYKNAHEVMYRKGKEEALKDLPRWRYKKGGTGPVLHDCIVLNKYGCIGKSPSGALLGDVWTLEYDELAKLPKENPGFKED